MNTWAEAMKAIGVLEDRVSELEHVVAFGQRNDSASLAHDGRIVVSANEWERLKGIESAAEFAVKGWHAGYVLPGISEEMGSLREALKR